MHTGIHNELLKKKTQHKNTEYLLRAKYQWYVLCAGSVYVLYLLAVEDSTNNNHEKRSPVQIAGLYYNYKGSHLVYSETMF